ncbi:putative sulfate/molybdate transporter [Chitinophagaceae bacterium LB-8]|uniref:Sulfate/molybdate transporter n=1 Tax=Paraflavisolibacter caeni TaxID=2982496 RepID=A0A9X3B9E0_9BACT|nr:putative sulfate/molybdate transporter [Paraflavisolibacter caeni]MCU7551121.1 putative sulfate/molybdate transporter [Paraflavisolibacter caeni]
MMRIGKIKFDRNELSGSFGDIGTDLPLLIGIILASGIDTASALIMFGLMQVLTAVKYSIPMSVQPLKAFATIVIAQKLTGDVIFAGGLVIGIIMFLLTISGLIEKLAVLVPKPVVRGIQFGLGIQLSMLAIKNYIGLGSLEAYVLSGVAFIVGLLLLGNRKYPPAIFIILLGVVYAIFRTDVQSGKIISGIKLHWPQLHYHFKMADMLTGFFLLALPQIPLSLGNSILATRQIVRDLFPEKKLTASKISMTYSLMNIINPFFCGIPTCHGSGGMAGHYIFGARTAGSIVIYGSFFLITGLFFSDNFQIIVKLFPLPVLGVILFFESLTLISLIKDVATQKNDLFTALAVGLICAFLPFGYGIGLMYGLVLHYCRLPRMQQVIEDIK